MGDDERTTSSCSGSAGCIMPDEEIYHQDQRKSKSKVGGDYSYSKPSYSGPATQSYSKPSYSGPSTPSYNKPSYSGPSTPSYSKPSYRGPSSQKHIQSGGISFAPCFPFCFSGKYHNGP